MKFGISTSYIEVDFFDELERICSRFDVVELALNYVDLDEDALKKMESILAANKTESCIHVPITDVNLCSPNAGVREESIRQAKKCVDIAKRLNSNPITLHFGRLPTFSASFEEIELITEKTRSEYFDLGIESLKLISEYAKENRVDLCVENMPNVYTEFCFSYKDIKRVLDDVDVLFTLDVGHANTVSSKHAFKLIKSFKDRLKHIHVHDNKGKWDEHSQLGEGTLNWSKIYQQLQTIGYDGYIIFELPFDQAVASLDSFIS